MAAVPGTPTSHAQPPTQADAESYARDIEAVSQVGAVRTMLEVICRTTGLGFAAVARVTPDRWIACAVRDEIAFGLEPGGELKVETTICHEIRQSGQLVVIDHVAEDRAFCRHPTPARYGFQSYISVPITLRSGRFFGTLCAIDPRPARLNTPETIGMFTLFAELIAFHLDACDRLSELEAQVAVRTAALHESNAALTRQIDVSEADRRTLRTLTQRLEQVREDERTALARDLHDEFGQILTALEIDVATLRKAVSPSSDSPAGRRSLALVDSMHATIESALDTIDRLVTDLRPMVLDACGCVAAVEWLVSEFQKRTGIDIRFVTDMSSEPSPIVATAVFRIVQEALTNVARHAHASSVDVFLDIERDMLMLRVEDDGLGITQERRTHSNGVGLTGMAERVRALNGSLTVSGRPAGGTALVVRIPVPEPYR